MISNNPTASFVVGSIILIAVLNASSVEELKFFSAKSIFLGGVEILFIQNPNWMKSIKLLIKLIIPNAKITISKSLAL